MGKKRKPTEKEYAEKKPKILRLFKQGFPMRRIQEKLDISQFYVKQIREELINEGIITREEIKKAFDEYMKKNPPAQGLNKTKVYMRYNTEKADARHARSLAKKEKTFELVKQKKSIVAIANEMQISETAVKGYMKKLVEEGRITEDEILRKPGGKPVVSIDRNSQEYIQKRDFVIELLKLGWKTGAIRKHLDITPFYINVFLRDIRDKKLVTPEQIKKAREIKKELDLQELEETITSGYTVDYFRMTHPEFTYNETTPLVKELIDKGKVTREQIEATRMRVSKERRDGNRQMSLEEQSKFILSKVKKGYTPLEILDSDKTGSLTMHKILYQKRQIIAKGILSAQEAERLMKERQKNKLNEKHKTIMDNIKEYVEQGYSIEEIAQVVGYNESYVSILIGNYKKEHGWYTKQELCDFKAKRKKKEKQKEIEARKKERAEKKEQEKQRKMQEIWKLRDLTVLGLSTEEILEEMHCDLSKIQSMQKVATKKGVWFSNEEIEFFRQQRIKKVAEEAARKQREEQKRIEKERREIKKKQDAIKRQENQQKGQIRYEIGEYSSLKKAAKNEDKREWQGEENVPFSARQKFTEKLIKMQNIGANISDKDIEIVLNAMYMHKEFITPRYLKFLISNALRTGGLANAEKMIVSLLSDFRDTEYYEPLLEYKKFVKNQRLKARIKELKAQGLDNAKIGDRLHISSAEVAILQYQKETKPKLLEEESRE